jgi:hypothetical protein
MMRGVLIQRAPSEKTSAADALNRYERKIVAAKKASTQRREGARIRELKPHFGKYSLAAITPDLVGRYRNDRLAQGKSKQHRAPRARPARPLVRRGNQGSREQALLFAAVDKHTDLMLG